MRNAVMLVVVLLAITTSVFAGDKKNKTKDKAKNISAQTAGSPGQKDRFAISVIPTGTMPNLIKGLSAKKEADNVKKIDDSMTKSAEYLKRIQTVQEQFKALYGQVNTSMSSVSDKIKNVQESNDKKEMLLPLIKSMKYTEFGEKMVLGQNKQFIVFKEKIHTFDFGKSSNGKALNQFVYIETTLKKHAEAMEKALNEYVSTVNEWNTVIKSFGLDG